MAYKHRLSMKSLLLMAISLILVLAVGLLAFQPVLADEGDGVDHSMFPQLAGPFESPQAVTDTCLQCHADAATDVMATVHWTWEYTDPETGQQLGKNNVINNYCMAMPSNEPRCTSCHIGYGYSNSSFFETATESNVDCLVCHATNGEYKKFPVGSGMPVMGEEAKEFPPGSGKMWQPVDLAAAAQSVGEPGRANCGSCHFLGGGGDSVKHGDLDTTLKNPTRDLDVHMGTDGGNLACADCHAGDDHEIKGRIYTGETPVLCVDCHTGDHAPHQDSEMGEALSKHADYVACQTCHIPEFARGQATKMTWDWSTAGEKNEDGKPFATKNDEGQVIYDSKKGSFTWGKDVVPYYQWWNGSVIYTTVEDAIDPDSVVTLTDFQGAREDGKIYPFKHFTGVQPYDAGNSTMVVPNLFPNGEDPDAYWKSWDWDKAVSSGMAYVGADFSGELGWVNTEWFWVQNHMVAPKEEALTCQSCHSVDGRLDFQALGYDEGRAKVLASFPPVPPTETPEPTPVPTDTPEPEPTVTPVPPTATSEPTEVPATEAPVVETPVVDETGSSSGVIIGVIVAVAVAAGVAFFFLRKK